MQTYNVLFRIHGFQKETLRWTCVVQVIPVWSAKNRISVHVIAHSLFSRLPVTIMEKWGKVSEPAGTCQLCQSVKKKNPEGGATQIGGTVTVARGGGCDKGKT
jgi:hypothetical protein